MENKSKAYKLGYRLGRFVYAFSVMFNIFFVGYIFFLKLIFGDWRIELSLWLSILQAFAIGVWFALRRLK